MDKHNTSSRVDYRKVLEEKQYKAEKQNKQQTKKPDKT
jgi:hypothetical protein